MPAGENGAFTIAHISDLHCGGPYFVPTLLERAISEINDMQPDLVVCSGDLTTFGFKPEYAQAKSYLDKIECESLVIVPGNHMTMVFGPAADAVAYEITKFIAEPAAE